MPAAATWIVLLRGINVGGNRRIAMADVRAAVADAGATDVVTYIQSGNVVARHATRSARRLVADLEASLAATAGFDIDVMVRTAAQWRALIAANPFGDRDAAALHVGVLAAAPDPARVAEVAEIVAALGTGEEVAVLGDAVYLHLPAGIGRSKAADAVGRLAVPITVRNWRTTLALAELAGVAS